MEKISEILNSVTIGFKNRFSNPFYGVYIVAWCLWNWRFTYSLLFLDQKLILNHTGIMKDLYLSNLIHDHNFFWVYIIPLGFTYLIIEILQKYVFLYVYKNEKEYEKQKTLIDMGVEDDINLKKISYTKTKQDVTKSQVELARDEKNLKDVKPEIVWENEYLAFKENPLFNHLINIKKMIYENNGAIIDPSGHRVASADILSYSDSLGLLAFSNNKATLLPKGKYFIKRFSEDSLAK